MDRRDLNRMFDALAPAPGREEELLRELLQGGEGRKTTMKNWKRMAVALAAAVLLVTTVAAASPELLEKLTVQFFPGDNGGETSYTVSGSAMTKYPLSAFSPELLAASEGREGPCAPVSLMFDSWPEVKAFLGEDIPCVWPGGGENWEGWFQVLLFHTEYDVLWGVDIYGSDLQNTGAEIRVEIRTELWPGNEARGGLNGVDGSLEQLDSYAMPNGAVAEIVQYKGPAEFPHENCTGYFMRDGMLYTVTALKTRSTDGTEEQLKGILDSFQ